MNSTHIIILIALSSTFTAACGSGSDAAPNPDAVQQLAATAEEAVADNPACFDAWSSCLDAASDARGDHHCHQQAIACDESRSVSAEERTSIDCFFDWTDCLDAAGDNSDAVHACHDAYLICEGFEVPKVPDAPDAPDVPVVE